jgi:hypothetical protein
MNILFKGGTGIQPASKLNVDLSKSVSNIANNIIDSILNSESVDHFSQDSPIYRIDFDIKLNSDSINNIYYDKPKIKIATVQKEELDNTSLIPFNDFTDFSNEFIKKINTLDTNAPAFLHFRKKYGELVGGNKYEFIIKFSIYIKLKTDGTTIDVDQYFLFIDKISADETGIEFEPNGQTQLTSTKIEYDIDVLDEDLEKKIMDYLNKIKGGKHKRRKQSTKKSKRKYFKRGYKNRKTRR